jgi:hypothetical protein
MKTQAVLSNITPNSQDYFEIAPGVWGMKIVFVNIFMIATGNDNDWGIGGCWLKGLFERY